MRIDIVKIHKSLKNLLNRLFKAKSNAETAERHAINNTAEGALRVFRIKIIPIQPKAEPIRLTP